MIKKIGTSLTMIFIGYPILYLAIWPFCLIAGFVFGVDIFEDKTNNG